MTQDSKTTLSNPDVHFPDESDVHELHSDPRDSSKVSAHRKAPTHGSQFTTPTLVTGANPRPERSPMGIVQVILGVAVVISAGYLAYSGLHNLPAPAEKSKGSAAAPPVVTVTTAAATLSPVNEVLGVTGTISSWDELKVGSELSGLHVKSIFVEEGDKVKKGQVLAELHAELLEAQLEQAVARLKSAEANLVKSVQPNRQEDIAGLKAAVEQAQSSMLQEKAHLGQAKVNLESAELNVPRYEKLANLGVVSAVDAETKRFFRDTAKLELESAIQKVTAADRLVDQANHRYLMASRGGRNEDVLITRATVEEIKAQIKHLSEQIKETKVRAQDDGLILQRNVHIGDTSDISKPLFVMSRLNRLELRAQINDTDLQKFRAGQDVVISSTEHEKGKIVGKVRMVSPQVDASSRLGIVRIDLPETSDFKPGMFVRGEISLTKHQGLTIPVTCLITRGGESFVFTLDGNRAVSTVVTTGMQTGDVVEIKSGLSAGQKVIDKGARFLSDRDVVDVPG